METVFLRSMIFIIIVQIFIGGVPTVFSEEPQLDYIFQVDSGISLDMDQTSEDPGKLANTPTGALFNNAWNYKKGAITREVGSGDYYAISQTVSSRDNNRLVFYQSGKWMAFDFPLDQKMTFDVRFKVETSSTEDNLRAGLRFLSYDIAGTMGDHFVSFNEWHTARYILDPGSRTVSATIDGILMQTGSYTQGVLSENQALQLGLIVQVNSDGDYVGDNVDLGRTVKWTFDHVKVGVDKEPEPEYAHVINIDDKMVLSGKDVTQGSGIVEYINWNTSSGYDASVENSGSEYVIAQTLAAQYRQRLMLTDAKSPFNNSKVQSQFDLNRPTMIETKFKICASSYPADLKAHLILLVGQGEYNSQGAREYSEQHFLNPGSKMPIELNASSEDVWYTVKYVFNPATKGMSMYVNDDTNPISSIYMDNIPNFVGILPGVYLGNEVEMEDYALKTTVTWTFDYFRVSQPIVAPKELLLIDHNMVLADAGSGVHILSGKGGVSHYNWLESYGPSLSLSPQNDKFIITQAYSSIYQQFLSISNPGSFPMDEIMTFTSKFAVIADDSTQFASMSLRCDTLFGNGNYFPIDVNIPVSTEENMQWKEIVFTVNPKAQTVKGEIDGLNVLNKTFTYTETAESYSNLRIYLTAQNKADTPSDRLPLVVPIKWIFDSFQVTLTETDDSSLPPPLFTEPVSYPIPEELRGRVIKSYPGGRMKAMIMSYDDGANWCLDSDIKAVEILNANGLKSAFNVVPKAGGYVQTHTLENLQNIYQGHEIASHSLTHPQFGEIDDEEFIREITDSKTVLETYWGELVPGLVYPYAYAGTPERKNMVHQVGYEYSRGGLGDTHSFQLPDTFFEWRPTVHLEGGTDLEYWQTLFANTDASTEMKLLFAWGHAWEFEKDTAVTPSREHETWDVFEAWCQYFKENSDTVWNPTPLELARYVRASRMLEVIDGGNGNIILKNPSHTVDVWVKVDREEFMVHKNSTIEIGGVRLIDCEVTKDAVDNQKINYIYKVRNDNASPKSFNTMAIFYDGDNKMHAIYTEKHQNVAGGTTTLPAEGSFSITGIPNYTVKMLIWEDFKNIHPWDAHIFTKDMIE